MPYVDQRWLGGMLTNFKTVKGSLKKLKDMQATKDAGMEQMIKKEALLFDRELVKLEKDIGGIQDMGALPDAMFVIDVGYHKIAVAEAKKLGIPVIGIVDTNHSPLGIDYVVPGNDDSAKAVALYARAVADAVLEGKANATSEVVQAPAAPGYPSRGGRLTPAALVCTSWRDSYARDHRQHGGRTARQDRRADDGMQEGSDRGRRRPRPRRGDPARQARQQGQQGRRAHHCRGRRGRLGERRHRRHRRDQL
jgi:hypothetical protein